MIASDENLNLVWFRNPPASHRSMPLWVWNGEMSEARITEMLRQFAALGMGGVFVHPRPGLVTEYLSERWFELWGHALAECKRLGLECNIYDENSYPAGFAGGHVPARVPHATAQYVEAVLHRSAPVRPEGELLGAFLLRGGAVPLTSGRPLDDAVKDGPILTLSLRRASGNPWTAWFPMTDTTRPEVAREFLATTYEPYAARFGAEFGRTVTTFFCDEPLVATAGAYSFAAGLPLSRFFLAEFRKEHGYDLLPRLVDLFVDQDGSTATRFDYFRTLQRLWSRNFLKPLHDWCGEHDVRLTGHFMEDYWPNPMMSPSCMEGFRWMQVPGVDLLAPQCDFSDPVNHGHFVMILRELNSAASQLGKRRRLCETHGVGGYAATFQEFKLLSDWVMVHGVNFVNQHLSFETICGARKYDHPQSFSDHASWWKSYRPLADHIARLSVLLSQGEQRNRVLVLHSTTTGWVRHNPARRALFGGGKEEDAMEKLRVGEALLVKWLADRQVDFDLGDELLMADFGSVEQGRLRIGERAYSVVIVPEGMENWFESTRTLIEKFQAAGGQVLALREPPTLVNGRPSTGPVPVGASWLKVDSLEQMQAGIDGIAPPLVKMADGKRLPPLVGHQMREFADGSRLHLLVNSGPETVRGEVRVTGASASLLDTFDGRQNPISFRRDGASLILPLELEPAGHVVWLIAGEASAPHASKKEETILPAVEIATFERIERTAPNVLMLDFCDLTVAGGTHPGLYVTRANRLCWQAHGFDQDVWDRTVQFRRNYLEIPFDAESGFRVDYHFEVGATMPLSLALEHPELYRVEVNARPVPFEAGRRWLDETIRAVGITEFLRPGRNTVSLIAERFHILCEIDRIYLLGDFALEPVDPGFRIVAPEPLKLGDWSRQGLAHYDGGVRYTARLMLEKPAQGILVETPRWAGSVIEVSLDGSPAGCIAFPPYRLRIERPLTLGIHELALEVVGTPRNLLGPHFCPPRTVKVGEIDFNAEWTGPDAWEQYPSRPAAGVDYRLKPYGLLAAPYCTPWTAGVGEKTLIKKEVQP